jgi:hypothetical protein
MHVTITISCDNDDFALVGVGTMLAILLRRLAHKVDGADEQELTDRAPIAIMDDNGNKVGLMSTAD